MKYLRFVGVLGWKLLAKMVVYIAAVLVVFGSIYGYLLAGWMVVAYKLRHYSTGVVFSYTLKNGLYLPRLTNNPLIEIVEVYKGWELHSKQYNKIGYVRDRDVSWIKYQLVYWLLWGWVDNDCDRDTVPIGYGRDILEGKHFANAPVWFLKRIAKEQAYLETREDGNAFARGDVLESNWTPVLSTMWMFRNLAYNFNYSLEEMEETNPLWFYYHNEKLKWHFGYIPSGDRKGRMVWFREDYDKVYGV